MENERFNQWAILELLGHRRLAGCVSEETIAGVSMLRIDIPAGDSLNLAAGYTTQYYSPSALYCLTPTTEAIVRVFCKTNQPTPIQRWELRTLEPSASATDLTSAPDEQVNWDKVDSNNAEIAYNAYAKAANWLTYDNKPMPVWNGTELPPLPDNIKHRWFEAARAIREASNLPF
jgi:hypothetical protein